MKNVRNKWQYAVLAILLIVGGVWVWSIPDCLVGALMPNSAHECALMTEHAFHGTTPQGMAPPQQYINQVQSVMAIAISVYLISLITTLWAMIFDRGFTFKIAGLIYVLSVIAGPQMMIGVLYDVSWLPGVLTPLRQIHLFLGSVLWLTGNFTVYFLIAPNMTPEEKRQSRRNAVIGMGVIFIEFVTFVILMGILGVYN